MAWSDFGIFPCVEYGASESIEYSLKLSKATGKVRNFCSYMTSSKDKNTT